MGLGVQRIGNGYGLNSITIIYSEWPGAFKPWTHLHAEYSILLLLYNIINILLCNYVTQKWIRILNITG